MTKGNDLFTARKNGVAFLLGPGVAAKELDPAGAAWKKLWEMQRLHGICFPPRAGLPHGLRVFSVYAPIWQLIMTPERKAILNEFHDAFREFVATLDMRVPTLFCGDWNGTTEPEKDYSEKPKDHRVRRCCPLLSSLLGPGGPLVDVVAIFPSARTWTFRGGQNWSRPDTILLSRSAVSLVAGFQVIEEISDGGHCPSCLTLKAPALKLRWDPPKPQLPPGMEPNSTEFQAALEQWKLSAEVKNLERTAEATQPTGADMAAALKQALEKLVALCGGWQTRPARPRKAYETNEMRQIRLDIRLLKLAQGEYKKWPDGPSPRPWPLERRVRELASRGIVVPDERAAGR